MLKLSTFKKNLANVVTMFGTITTISCGVLIYDNGIKWIVPIVVLAFISAATDWFDGRVARWFNISSELGAIFDKVRDKAFLSLFATWMICRAWKVSFIEGFSAITIFAITSLFIILCVEIMLIVVELILLHQKKSAAPSNYGKRKMALYYIGILVWLLSLAMLKESSSLIYFPALILSIGLYFAVKGFLNYAKRLSIATTS